MVTARRRHLDSWLLFQALGDSIFCRSYNREEKPGLLGSRMVDIETGSHGVLC